MNKTITFDPAEYKLVPIISSTAMDRAADKVIDDDGCSSEQVFTAILSAVPDADQLPGVVVHEGEPVAWAVVSVKGGINKLSITKESADNKAAKLKVEWPNNGCRVEPLYNHPAPSQPSAEALVQAALEAALDAVQNVEINCDASGAAIGSAERRIRALSAQQIIESCKEKS